MKIHPFTLAFQDEWQPLEAEYARSQYEKTLLQTRVAILIAILFYAFFGVLDAYLVPEKKYLFWMIRYVVVCPLAFLVFLFSFTRYFKRHKQISLFLMFLVGGFGIDVMILLAPPPAADFYYAGLILVFIYLHTFLRIRFIWAFAASWLMVLFYEIVAVNVIHTPPVVLINNNFFIVAATIFCNLAGYALELSFRRNFLLNYMLDQERKGAAERNRELAKSVEQLRSAEAKLLKKNLEIEKIVQERTSQIEQTSKELAQEVMERKHAEAERIRLADQLKRVKKMETVGNVVAGVAHDLNNILTGLVSYPELLLMELPEDSPFGEAIRTIKNSGEKAAAVVQDLLTLARRGVPIKKVVDPNQIIKDYFNSPEFLDLQGQHPHVRFHLNLNPDGLNVFCSPVHLSKTLMNLVCNAAESLLVAGDVTIATTNLNLDQPLERYETIGQGDYVVLRVADTGVGIAQKDLKQIFEPFYTKKRMGRSGTGLGMSVVWNTVKDTGGYIDIQSEEGKGTTFSLYLPVMHEEIAPEDSPVAIEDYRGTEKVLVVDDLPGQQQIAAAMLGKLGYEVHAVSSGEEAIAYLREKPADILVLDMIMDPGMDGCETYRRILEQHPGQKAIIASGFFEPEKLREIQGLGAGAYIIKPYTLEKLVVAVRYELDRR